MLQIYLPPNLNYFLLNYLNYVRLKFDGLQNFFFKQEAKIDEELGEASLSFLSLLKQCGYAHQITLNLVLVLFLFALMLVLLLTAFICDFASRRKRKNKRNQQCGAWFVNFNLRFMYEFYLELCICVAVQISLFNASD